MKCLENVSDAAEAKMANFKGKKHLGALRFEWCSSKEDDQHWKAEEATTSTQFETQTKLFTEIFI